VHAFDVSCRVLAAVAIPAFVAWAVAPALADESPTGTQTSGATDGAAPALDGAIEAHADQAQEGGVSAEAASAPPGAPPADGGAGGSPSAATPSLEGGAPQPLAWDEKLSFGIRAEYAFPLGTATQTPLSDVVAGAFQLGGEIGYQLFPRFSVLLYFSYGFANVAGGASTTCSDPTLQCSADVIRFGAAANYHFRSRSLSKRLVDPWVGLGVGYEVLNESSADDTGATQESVSLNGFELSSVLGAELRPAGNFGIGPYVQASVGHYFSDVSPPAFHGWLTLGLRLRMGP
jgi:hypothetical protein